jgi:putative transposase
MKQHNNDDWVYYITTAIYNRLPILVRPTYVIALIDSLNYYRYKHHFLLPGYVIMPDHIHLLISPHSELDVSAIMRDFKKFTSVRIIRQAEVEGKDEWLSAFEAAGQVTGRSQKKVWQDSFWDKAIYSERFLRQKLNYIHRNPVRAEFVDDPGKFPYSSYRNYVDGDDSLIEIDKGWLGV